MASCIFCAVQQVDQLCEKNCLSDLQKPAMIGEYSVMKLKQRPLKFCVGGESKSFDEDSYSAETLQDSDSDAASPMKEGRGGEEDSVSSTPRKLPRKRGTNQVRMLQSEQVKTTDSESNQPQSDDSSGQSSTAKKSVAIDITQNEHFTHRPMPLQSQEFDNVMDQVRYGASQERISRTCRGGAFYLCALAPVDEGSLTL